MSEEKTRDNDSNDNGVRPVQVIAAALAAVTAAILGSTLGVAGTVMGAGIASVVTTVGGELYVRSLKRTKDAAAALSVTRTERTRIVPPVTPSAATVAPEPERAGRPRKFRWPLIIGTSAIAFVIGMLALTGIEYATGGAITGTDGKTTIGQIGGGSKGGEQRRQPDGGPIEEPSSTSPTPSGERPSGGSSATTTRPAEPPPTTTPPTTSTPPTTTPTPTGGNSTAPTGQSTP
ncbi:hypothetical protein [Herbihabitans rhizosphaerae]|nr:hypothetical protein [Herbihabitans rhizosphaerae]